MFHFYFTLKTDGPDCYIFSRSAICINGGRKEYCKLCDGSQICEHDNRREYCKLCDGSQICEHEIRREKLKNYLDRLDDNAFENLSEKEAVTILAQMESTEDELYKAKKKFITSIKGVISPIKILKLKKQQITHMVEKSQESVISGGKIHKLKSRYPMQKIRR